MGRHTFSHINHLNPKSSHHFFTRVLGVLSRHPQQVLKGERTRGCRTEPQAGTFQPAEEVIPSPNKLKDAASGFEHLAVLIIPEESRRWRHNRLIDWSIWYFLSRYTQRSPEPTPQETARSATTYSHAHSPSDGRQSYSTCLSLVSCKAVCVLCFIKGLRLGSTKEGPCLPYSGSCSPGYAGRSGTLLLPGHRATRKVGWEKRAGFYALYIQTYPGNTPRSTFLHPWAGAGQLQGPCGCYSLIRLKSLFLGNKLSLGALPLTNQPAGRGWWKGMQHHSLLLNIQLKASIKDENP